MKFLMRSLVAVATQSLITSFDDGSLKSISRTAASNQIRQLSTKASSMKNPGLYQSESARLIVTVESRPFRYCSRLR